MTLIPILRTLSSTLAALALFANAASAENRPIHPLTVAPKVTTNPPPPGTPGSGGPKQGAKVVHSILFNSKIVQSRGTKLITALQTGRRAVGTKSSEGKLQSVPEECDAPRSIAYVLALAHTKNGAEIVGSSERSRLNRAERLSAITGGSS